MAAFHLPKERIETLVDGVFAIAMTILVLELKVPPDVAPLDSAALFHHLNHELPTIAAYFFSFFMLGIFWVWFHRLSSKISTINPALLGMQLLFLSLVSAFPFAAALLGRYPLNAASLAVYLPVIGLILTIQGVSFYYADARGLVRPDVTRAEVVAAKRRNLRGLMFFAIACIPSGLRIGLWGALPCVIVAIACAIEMRRQTKLA